MKATKFIFTCMVFFISYALIGQDTLNKNLPSPPPWGPAGYSNVRYYYLPDVESYYDIYAEKFVCNIEGKWLHRNRLPSQYRKYDFYMKDTKSLWRIIKVVRRISFLKIRK